MWLIFLIVALWSGVCFAQSPYQEIIRLINQERVHNGLDILTEDERLSKAAQCQADWMIKIDKMDHYQGEAPKSQSYSEFKKMWSNSEWHAVTRIVKFGYAPIEAIYKPVVQNGQEAAVAVEGIHELIGENVAYGSKHTPMNRFSPQRIVQGWMDSPGHRKAILNPKFKEIGVGYAITPKRSSKKDKAAAWCTVFSTPELRDTVRK